jgi:4-aminobutyrate aminotransferase
MIPIPSDKANDFALIPDQPEAPRLVTPIPGPKAAAIIERDKLITSPSYTRDYPLVISRGRGLAVEDPDGNRFLDFTAGIAVTSTGHCHPHVLRAIHAQTERFLHMSGTDFYYELQAELGEKLARTAPMSEPVRILYTNSGAESIEGAFKLARHHTGRKHVIAFYGAFHGRTLGALSLTASKAVQRHLFQPLVPEVTHVHYPACYRCPERGEADGAECCGRSIREIEELFKRTVAPSEVAAIFVEPIQGEGGYIVPPASFMRSLREICDKYGILFVCDEVQAGMGRTGKMWGIQNFGVEPDMITTAKGLASGMPLGAFIARADIMDWGPGAHASTFGGNPVSCAAAIATLELLERGLLDHVNEVGAYLHDQLRALVDRHDAIGESRGIGLMAAIDFVKNPETREADVTTRNAVVQAAFRRGLLLLGCGESAIRFSPALIVSRAQIDTALEILDDAIIEVTDNRQAAESVG